MDTKRWKKFKSIAGLSLSEAKRKLYDEKYFKLWWEKRGQEVVDILIKQYHLEDK